VSAPPGLRPGRRALLASLPAALALAACQRSGSGPAPAGRPEQGPGTAPAKVSPLPVLASFSIVGDIVREVAGPLLDLAAIAGPNQDAHHFDPTPSQLIRLGQVRLLVRNGLGFESWLDRIVEAGGFSGTLVTAADAVTPLVNARGRPDPHIWQSHANVKAMAALIARQIAVLLPPTAAASIEDRLADFRQRVDSGLAAAKALIDAIPAERRMAVVPHNSFAYMGAELGVRFTPLAGLSPESQPSAADIADLVDQVRRSGARAIFPENIADDRVTRQIGELAGLKVGSPLYSDALSAPDAGAGTILQLLSHNARCLAVALA
jgi:zinc/manganese transport system substrate-binding protein